MALSWNEIKTRALTFSKEWQNTEREAAEAKPFLIAFLNIFGISRKKVATFEQRVKRLGLTDGYITYNLSWPKNPANKQKESLEKAAKFAYSSLHQYYGRAVDNCYGGCILKDVVK